MNEKICGTYWLVNFKGCKYITQGNKPTYSESIGWIRGDRGMLWLLVEGDPPVCKRTTSKTLSGKTVTTEDFADLSFPDIPEKEAVEIEIGKSGRVYTYES